MPIPDNVRTYLPKLIKILLMTCNYLRRYRETILKYLPSGSDVLIDNLLTACEALEIVVSAQIPPDA